MKKPRVKANFLHFFLIVSRHFFSVLDHAHGRKAGKKFREISWNFINAREISNAQENFKGEYNAR